MIVVPPITVTDATLFGPDNILNGKFDSDTVWNKGTDWTIASGVANKATGAASPIGQAYTDTKSAVVTFTILNYVQGTLTPQFIGGATVTGTTVSANGTFTQFITPDAGVTDFELLSDTLGDFDVDNVTVGAIGSNVPENDNPEWSTTEAISIGDVRMVSVIEPDIHRNYEALTNMAGSPGIEPWTDQEPAPVGTGGTNWLDLGATNRWAMFDEVVGTTTTNPDTIDVTVTAGQLINAVAALNISAATIKVEVTDPAEGLVYSREETLIAPSTSADWYSYFFDTIERQTDIVFLDLPAFGNASVNVLLTETGATVSAGVVALGVQKFLGTTIHGTGVGIIDFSIKTTDAFGNQTITPRAFSKRAEYAVVVNTNSVASVENFLSSIRTVPVVWVGSENFPSTLIYGYYRDFDTILANFTTSSLSITVEGLT